MVKECTFVSSLSCVLLHTGLHIQFGGDRYSSSDVLIRELKRRQIVYVVLHEQVNSPFFEDQSLLSDDIVLFGGWFQNNNYQPIGTFVRLPNNAVFRFILFVLLIIFGFGYLKCR